MAKSFKPYNVGQGEYVQASTPASGSSGPATSTMPQANDADRAFVDGMIPHHEGAVAMADDALVKASRVELKDFARKVQENQAKEIAEMRTWRQAWFGSATPSSAPHPGHAGMPTSFAAGQNYDKTWAEAMIVHHQGAIDMARTALTQAARPETKALAQRIIDAQMQEQAQLRAWTLAWGG